jgi:PAS domain S-box-containing protein
MLGGRVGHRWLLLVGIALAGTAITLGVFFFVRHSEQLRVRDELAFRAESQARDFDRKLSLSLRDIAGIATLMAAQSRVDDADFVRYAEMAHRPDSPYSALAWAPLVKAADRAAFVAAARAQVAAGYDITQRDAEGRLVAAGSRADFLPILYAANFDRRIETLGFDLIQRADRRRDLERAGTTGKAVATAPTIVYSSVDQAPGFIVFWPVYATGPGLAAASTTSVPQAGLRGAVVAVFRFDRLLATIAPTMENIPGAVDLYVDADASGGTPIHVASFDPRAGHFIVGATAAAAPPGSVAVAQGFTFLGRRWTLRAHFPLGFVAGLGTYTPLLWLGFGLLLTALATATVARERGRLEHVSALVSERTAALALTNWALSRAVDRHREAEQSAVDTAERLARSEQRLKAVLDSTVDGIVTIDASGTVLSFSPPAERIFGYRADEVLGRNVKMLMPEAYARAHDPYLAAYAETGVAKIIGIGREVTGRRKDGSEFPIDLGVGELPASDGQREFVGSVRDISARVAAEAGMRRSQALLQATFDASPFAIVIRDAYRRILFWNRAAETLFGYAAAEVLGRVGPPPDDDVAGGVFESIIQRVKAGETISGIGQDLRRKGGSVVQVRRTIAPIYIAGEFSGFVGLIEDVTEHNAIERQLVQAQKMEAIGNLTGGIAHDFNNLLGIAIGNLDLLRPLLQGDAEEEELVDDALNAALRGADLTRQLLAFARRQPLRPCAVDLNELVGDVGRLLGRTLDQNIALKLQLGPEVWRVVVDPTQLESSLMNLATNARDAMPRGGTLTIVIGNRQLDEDYAAAHPEVTAGDYAMIEVSDTGIGMSAEIARQIFEPFFTTKPYGRGTGLGLSMVFGFVKQSGGHINVYSEPGVGTTFRLYLPRNESAALGREPRDEVSVPPARGETILVVEDNDDLRRVVTRQLRELGYHTIEAHAGAAALRLLAEHEVDLLFSDIVLPGGIDGFEVTRRAIQLRPYLKVVLTSGFPGARTNDELNRMGHAVRLLTKPYRKDELAVMLRAALDASRPNGSNGSA